MARLVALCGPAWTDLNDADPGVTLLEALCWAVTDLAYRSGHPVADLLAETGDPLPTAARTLTCGPVTLHDLRSVALDVPGVRNAWVEPVREPAPLLHHAAGTGELGFTPVPGQTEPVALKGLYRVLVEPEVGQPPAELTAAVATRLHACRPVGEDLTEVRVLPEVRVAVRATVELDVGVRPDEVLVGLLAAADGYLSPPVRREPLAELLAAGTPVDLALEGPVLEHGAPDAEAAAAGRRRTARSSDLVAALAAVPGVRVVRLLHLLSGGAEHPWSLRLDAEPVASPRLDLAACEVVLLQGAEQVVLSAERRAAVHAAVLAGRTPPRPGRVPRGPAQRAAGPAGCRGTAPCSTSSPTCTASASTAWPSEPPWTGRPGRSSCRATCCCSTRSWRTPALSSPRRATCSPPAPGRRRTGCRPRTRVPGPSR